MCQKEKLFNFFYYSFCSPFCSWQTQAHKVGCRVVSHQNCTAAGTRADLLLWSL